MNQKWNAGKVEQKTKTISSDCDKSRDEEKKWEIARGRSNKWGGEQREKIHSA